MTSKTELSWTQAEDPKLAALMKILRDRENPVITSNGSKPKPIKLKRVEAKWPRLELIDAPGPVMLICGTMCEGARRPAVGLLRRYAPKARGANVSAIWTRGERNETWPSSGRVTEEDICRWKI